MTASRPYQESREEMERLLGDERVGYLGLSRDGQPYVVPLTYGYVAGRILFHGAAAGKKLDWIRSNPRVCFTVARQFGDVVPHPQGAACQVYSDSVVCYGTARVLDDIEERRRALNTFNQCLAPGAKDLTRDDVADCLAVEITVEEMTGRLERDSKCTWLTHRFAT